MIDDTFETTGCPDHKPGCAVLHTRPRKSDAERTAALVSALEFYADEGTWQRCGETVCMRPTACMSIAERHDSGDLARAALAAYRQARAGGSSGAEGGEAG